MKVFLCHLLFINLVALFIHYSRLLNMPANIGAITVGVVVLVAVLMQFALHRIEEGHVGVYYRVSHIDKL